MDFNKFKTQLAQSTKQAFLEIYTQNPEQDIYAFALCNNDSTISIHPSANSIEYLNEVADENDFHFYKFEPSEWKFEQHQSKRLFDEINENCKKIVNEHDDDEDWFYHFQNQINDACIEVLENLKAENFKIIGIEQTSNSEKITDFPIHKDEKYALVLGNEVDGLSDEAFEFYDTFLEIPQLGTKHSLNVSVCGGIVMWEFFKSL